MKIGTELIDQLPGLPARPSFVKTRVNPVSTRAVTRVRLDPMTLSILYQDHYLVAVYKPAGLLVHRTGIAAGQDDRFALQLVRDQIGRHVYPLHRLDRPTAGVLLFALDPDTNRALKEAFTGREIAKTYLAVVRGWTDREGTIDYPLKKANLSRRERRRRQAGAPEPEPRPALTRFRLLATTELPHPVGRYATARYSLAEIYPETGRTHQIRRHLAHIAHPIVGDARYGDGAHNRFFRETFDSRRLLLLARSIRFSHPATGRELAITAEPDDEWQALMGRLAWQPLV